MDLFAAGAGTDSNSIFRQGGKYMDKDIMRYSMQLAMLKQLLNKNLITEKEYSMVKAKLMQDYNISSNLTVPS